MGQGVFAVEVDSSAEERAGGSFLAKRIREHADRQPTAFYYAKVDVERVDVVRQLGSAGFYVVDVNVTFGMEPSEESSARRMPSRDGWTVDGARPEHHDQILDIAASCFRYSRFHVDPEVPRELANRIKREWMNSCLRRERGEEVLVASRRGRVAGFLAILAAQREGRQVRVVDLIGVSSACQRQGVGRELMQAFIRRSQNRCDWLELGTQAANLPSIRMCQQLGFLIVNNRYVLHCHTRHHAHRTH